MNIIDIDPVLEEIDDIFDYGEDEYDLGYQAGINRVVNIIHKQPELTDLEDKVVVPTNYRECNSSITGYFATCKCGREVSWERYCPYCGSKILWKLVIPIV